MLERLVTPERLEAMQRAGVDAPARDARVLMRWVEARFGHASSPEAEAALEAALARRSAREPVAKIIGRKAFWNHEFEVTRDVLDPRPETETLVEAALAEPFERVLDLGVGSGAILLSLLAERPEAEGVGADVSPEALGVARRNALKLGVAERVTLVYSDWFSAVAGAFDLIVANPPYISAEEIAALAPELSYEPRVALTDEGDGLAAYRVICAEALAFMRLGGRLMVEIGWQQGADVAQMMRQAGLEDVQALPDLDGRDRVVLGRKAT